MLSVEADNDPGVDPSTPLFQVVRNWREPVRPALLDANGPTGTFSNEDGARSRGDVDPNV
jgi:hypothetical protein